MHVKNRLCHSLTHSLTHSLIQNYCIISKFETADSRQQTSGSGHQTSGSRQQTADSRQQTADRQPGWQFCGAVGLQLSDSWQCWIFISSRKFRSNWNIQRNDCRRFCREMHNQHLTLVWKCATSACGLQNLWTRYVGRHTKLYPFPFSRIYFIVLCNL